MGGDSGILESLAEYRGNIYEIKAVINGTLNYIGEKLSEGLSREDIYQQVQEKGFAEPGSCDFQDVINNEMKDVLLKTAILANCSNLYDRIIKPEDLFIEPNQDWLRCFVLLTKKQIKSGFMEVNDISWFPAGVNNILYINNQKIIEGAGAGGRATAERMLKDYKKLGLY